MKSDEVLRAEWAARVSALDLYVHELVAQGMTDVFNGVRAATPSYMRFKVSNEALDRIRKASTPTDSLSYFDLEVRDQMSRATFQLPDDIADGIRHFSTVELWHEVAVTLGAPQAQKSTAAGQIKAELTLMVRRRNKIVHEGDLQPTAPRVPWPISQGDLMAVSSHIERVVRAIDVVTK